ncbi:MAG: hypothetical protein HN494_05955 [Opitutae bacterium]|nr:hypothetical protein [Opitutae bacterium]MBT5910743.1 hypothetical protein [Opitutae bacterium]MBT6849999.1 hypothetical protein [Opitutae bacterium]MBT7741834.1 hypothetical protein [Opitutae bacterium]MBT7923654.1 hypothetical protein [Opitutae bacterium]
MSNETQQVYANNSQAESLRGILRSVTGASTSIDQTVGTIADSPSIPKSYAGWFCREEKTVVPESRQVLPVG